MKLVIVHNHFRPGGVRRVIELATPYLLTVLRSAAHEVVLVGGEAPDRNWLRNFAALLGEPPLRLKCDPALNYLAEQRRSPKAIARRVRGFLDRLFAGCTAANCVVWAHNQGLGRNLPLTRELIRACERRGLPLQLHHHDWWFDNRWQRWPEMRHSGFRSLAQVAETILSVEPVVRHIAINHADASVLQRHFGRQSGWLPNLVEPAPPVPPTRVRFTRRWLREHLDEDAPVWLLPCRLLRRKNVAESLLLTRWLRPQAWLVTTGGVSSAEEMPYARKLEDAARRHGWRLRLGILQNNEAAKPTVPELLAASEVVMLTSVQEGFGLPYLEAAASRRPLIARALPNVAPDLARFGFRFPQGYDDVLVHPRLFNWDAEQRRQARRFQNWRRHLPHSCQALANHPLLLGLKRPQPVPFSRLTLTAQLEVLAQPIEVSWSVCAPLNPRLVRWRAEAAQGQLRVSGWPSSARRWLSGKAYARRWSEILRAKINPPAKPELSRKAQSDFIARKLAAENLYPLTWKPES